MTCPGAPVSDRLMTAEDRPAGNQAGYPPIQNQPEAGVRGGARLCLQDQPQQVRWQTDGWSYQPTRVWLAGVLRLVRWTQPRPGVVAERGVYALSLPTSFSSLDQFFFPDTEKPRKNEGLWVWTHFAEENRPPRRTDPGRLKFGRVTIRFTTCSDKGTCIIRSA